MNKKVYAQIPNTIFSVATGEKTNTGSNKFSNKDSMFDITKDDKIVKIIYELLVGTDFRGLCTTNVNKLIERCSYPTSKDNQKSFKNILVALNETSYISIDKKDFKTDTILEIDTDILKEQALGKYTVLEQKEIDMINSIVKDNRQRNTLLKVYLFIKMMCHKRDDKTHAGLSYECDSQTIAIDYKYINKFTGIKDISKCIKTLKDNDMIRYDSFIVAPQDNPSQKQNSKNVYAVAELSDYDIELCEMELKAGLKQYKHELVEKQHMIICKDYKNNDKSANGRKGKSVQMKNQGKDTTEIDNKIKKIDDAQNKILDERPVDVTTEEVTTYKKHKGIHGTPKVKKVFGGVFDKYSKEESMIEKDQIEQKVKLKNNKTITNPFEEICIYNEETDMSYEESCMSDYDIDRYDLL
ncbi:hypothetical protein HYH39_06725 [Clostridium botulinum]|uniref:hypothetical protein n=1 Tax=Clostridium botulinum TaxID=1491 RepID=UPI0005013D12|nr:hypothetical protein [Clostridium botulinum]KFX58342.1 hypothetical protein KU40_04605 [Clostridium botulinum]MBN1058573.1 hypothetical protein [Clostridium botulinum]MBY6778634.1 hypothetical protein [Clostridium botulinum]MBY6851813.1 hypothetical protein [Clostridium botulinum]